MASRSAAARPAVTSPRKAASTAGGSPWRTIADRNGGSSVWSGTAACRRSSTAGGRTAAWTG
ncbi:hypothetical protein WJ0W_004304 [Paenibacillus melissococcoides]|uniref:Uncharacterized protein n=1 Tax=Paenibacillus melissococcoides TaxID=2912268 RepID=A0ABM9G5H4_9BACL|nr:hypothetical protein WJ0W_004304 [Paenibacillus melissococcoides]